MCLKHVGVEIPLMMGTRPQVVLHVVCRDQPVCKLPLKRDRLPHTAELPPEFLNILELDKRAPGEHRPLRLVLGRVDREPYQFFSAQLPGDGLLLPEGGLRGNLALELWVESPQPLWPYPVLFYLRGSDPVVHPFGNRVLWVSHQHWTGAWQLGGTITARDESPCGCCMRTRLHFGPMPVPLINADQPAQQPKASRPKGSRPTAKRPGREAPPSHPRP